MNTPSQACITIDLHCLILTLPLPLPLTLDVWVAISSPVRSEYGEYGDCNFPWLNGSFYQYYGFIGILSINHEQLQYKSVVEMADPCHSFSMVVFLWGANRLHAKFHNASQNTSMLYESNWFDWASLFSIEFVPPGNGMRKVMSSVVSVYQEFY